jgi:hypothetical protein
MVQNRNFSENIYFSARFSLRSGNCQVIFTQSELPVAGIFRISVMFQDNNGRTWQCGTKPNTGI